MPTIRSVHESDQVKVAAYFEESGEIRPAWFQAAGREPVRVTQVSALWYSTRGSSRILNFEVGGGGERYCLSYNTIALSWSLGRKVIE